MTAFSVQTKRRICLLVVSMIVITAGSAFSIVWMQQQINRTAKSSQELEIRLAEKTRKLRYLDERIASVHQPVVLQGKVAGKLRRSTEDQIVWVREDTLPSGRAFVLSEPYEASMDLAFIDFGLVSGQ